MKQTIKKALIPVAGRGTRFMPATKSVAKELFPIVDQPQLLMIAEEAVRAGAEEIVLITGSQKTSIEAFFSRDPELEDFLASTGKEDIAKKIREISSMAKFTYVRQDEARGLGHAVLTGKKAIGDNPFFVLLGDELMYSPTTPEFTLSDLTQCFQETSSSCVTLMKVPLEHVCRYGIADVADPSTSPQAIMSLIEKPSVDETPSQWALPGRYLFTPDIFSILEDTKPGRNNEIQLTDAINELCGSSGVYGVALNSNVNRYDAGDKFGFIQANIEIALNHPEVSEKIKAYIIKKAKDLL